MIYVIHISDGAAVWTKIIIRNKYGISAVDRQTDYLRQDIKDWLKRLIEEINERDIDVHSE